MRFSLVASSLAGVALATTATTHDGLVVVTREVFPAATLETTDYVVDDRARRESRSLATTPAASRTDDRVILIRRCDLNTIFVVNERERTYYTSPLWLQSSVLERAALALAPLDAPRKDAPEILVETMTVDTGERKAAFGYPARRVVTTRRQIEGGRASVTETDGWYIDLETRPSCERQDTGRAVLIGTISAGSRRNRALPRVTFKDIGRPESGFPIEESRTFRSDDASTGASRPAVTRMIVTHVSRQQVDGKLFEVPQGFRSADGALAMLFAGWRHTTAVIWSTVAGWFH